MEYGAVMLSAPLNNWGLVLKQIKQEHIYNNKDMGLETYPHVTLLYGLEHDVDYDSVARDVSFFTPLFLEIENVSLFEKEDFEVLKCDIKYNEYLHSLNDFLKSKYKHKQLYDKYHPHMTITYLKKGTGKYYVNSNVKKTIFIHSAIISTPNDDKIAVKLLK